MGGRDAQARDGGPAARLPATRVSTALQPVLRFGWMGEVVGRHRSAVTIATGRGLVTIASDAAGGLPDGINVGPAFSPAGLGIVAGARVRLDADTIVIGDHLAVDLGSAARWSPALRPIAVGHPRLTARTARAEDACRGIRTGSAPSAPPDVADLVAALRAGDGADQVVAAGLPLIGLGPGLTPAGDDVLIGLVAALTAVADPRARSLAVRWAAVAPTRTTPIAAGFHRHAADGNFAERLHDLLTAILAGPVAGIPDAVAAAAAWGATSGADTVLGVCVGLAARAESQRRGRVRRAA